MSVLIDFLRIIAGLLDIAVYSLANFIYEIFCAVATSTIIKSDTIKSFTERIYVIVGVFTLFKVGFTFLKYIVNPDQMTDSKVGYNKLIWNITIALVLLVSIPTLYDFAMRAQASILKSNIIPKIMLGKETGSNSSMRQAGKDIVYTTLSAFIVPNYDVTDSEGKYVVLEQVGAEKAKACFNMELNGTVANVADYPGIYTYKMVKKPGSEETEMTYTLTDDCNTAFGSIAESSIIERYKTVVSNKDYIGLIDIATSSKMNDEIQEAAGKSGFFNFQIYFLKYTCIISTLVGLFLCFIFVSYTFDVAIRAIKLGFLILISPIPVLSMINPEKGARGMLSEWWKMTFITYIDLFIRIASIFFVIFVINNVDLIGTVSQEYGFVVGLFAWVFIIIGALLFAKQLPELLSKLIPGMDSIVKGGINPLKKLGEAAKVAGHAPIAGKGLTNLANRFATQNALNRAQRKMDAAKRNEAQKDFDSKMSRIKNNKNMTDAQKAAAMKKLEDEHKEKLADLAKESAQRKEDIKDEAKFAGQQAAAGVSALGGESKPITSAGAAVAKINKESAEKIHKMQMAAKNQRRADENLAKVEEQATSERNDEIKQKEKQIVDVQREAEIQKRMKDAKYKDMTKEEARSAATREVQEMEQQAASTGKSATTMYSELASEAAKKQAQLEGKSATEVEAAGAAAAKKSRSDAEEAVVGSLSDKMDEVAERTGVIYSSKEYAEQVSKTREAKNRRNAVQSQYEKAARQQQSTGTVTAADGTVLEGQAAIDYVDKLRVDYTKASGDYDFMNKELDSMGEQYPEDAATRKGYEAAKDYRDKSSKIESWASKSSKVSNNEREGGQYTIEDLIQEDTVVNRVRRADAEFAGTRQQIISRQTELRANDSVLRSQIEDNRVAGNTAEVTRLQNELNVNSVELGRVNTSLAAANIARNNTIAGLNTEKATIETTLQGLETEYQQVLNASDAMMRSGQSSSPAMTEIQSKREELEQKMKVLADRSNKIDADLATYTSGLGSVSSGAQATTIDTRISGTGSFDRIGTPIRTQVENIVNQMELDIQRMNDAALSAQERTKAKLAVESALSEYDKAVKTAGANIYSGMSNDVEAKIYDKKMSGRIDAIKNSLNGQQGSNQQGNNP